MQYFMSRRKGEFFFCTYMQLLFPFSDSVGIYSHQNNVNSIFCFPSIFLFYGGYHLVKRD